MGFKRVAAICIDVHIIKEPIRKSELTETASKQFGDFVKAVVDLQKNIIAIGGEPHADEETVLLERGSQQQNLWGIKLYPAQPEEQRIEFDSMINVRPSQGNRFHMVEDAAIEEQIRAIVQKLIQP